MGVGGIVLVTKKRLAACSRVGAKMDFGGYFGASRVFACEIV